MEFSDYGGFLAITVMAVTCYILSVTARRLRRSFADRSTAWLDSVQKSAHLATWIGGASILLVIGARFFFSNQVSVSILRLVVVLGGVGLANFGREVSSYATSELEKRAARRSNHAAQPIADRFRDSSISPHPVGGIASGVKDDRLRCTQCKTAYPKWRLICLPKWSIFPCPSCKAPLRFSTVSSILVGLVVALIVSCGIPFLKHTVTWSPWMLVPVFVVLWFVSGVLRLLLGTLELVNSDVAS